MKKIILFSISMLFTSSLFAQSILLSPNSVETKHSTYESILLKGTATPNIVGFRHNGTLSNPTATIDGNILLSVEGRGYGGGDFTGVQSALRFIATQNWNANNRGTKAEIFTTENNSTLALSRVFINQNGKVGIGNYLTTTPSHQLEVLQPENDDKGVGVFRYGGDAPSIFGVGSRGSIIIPTATLSGDILGRFGAKGHDGTDYTTAKARIDMLSNQNWTSTTTGSDIRFYATLAGTSTISEKMVIQGNGNVGIGDANPTSKLTINGDYAVKTKTITGSGSFPALNREASSVIYFSVIGTVNLRGIGGGQDGLILHIYNALNSTLNIFHEDGAATTANQIWTQNSNTVTINGRGGCTMIYDATNQKWRIIGVAL